MGQKVHPESIRVGYIHDWKSNWFNEKNFADFLHEDTLIREHIVGRLSHAGLSDITIRKNATEVEINIHTARPGIVIGKSGVEVDALTDPGDQQLGVGEVGEHHLGGCGDAHAGADHVDPLLSVLGWARSTDCFRRARASGQNSSSRERSG